MTADGIYGASPWTRQAIVRLSRDFEESYERLVDAIPAGCYIVLTCALRPGPWGAVLMEDAIPHNREVARVRADYPTVLAACYAVLEQARVEREVVA